MYHAKATVDFPVIQPSMADYKPLVIIKFGIYQRAIGQASLLWLVLVINH